MKIWKIYHNLSNNGQSIDFTPGKYWQEFYSRGIPSRKVRTNIPQRNIQTLHLNCEWRNLHSDEVERLVKNNNTSSDWDEILVTDQFDANQIKNTRFYGLVRIGCLRNVILQHHDLKLPAGITNSVIISCDIGDDVAIHNVHYLAAHIIGNNSILLNIDEMHTTDHAKFGNGILKDGEPESVRTWLDVMNEMGGRRISPLMA